MISPTRRKSTTAAAAVLALATVAACGSGDGDGDGGSTVAPEDVEISVGFAGGGAMDAYMETLLERVREEMPDITVTPVVYPTYDDQLNQMPTQFAGGTAPDIVLWDNAAPVAQYASEGAIVPLQELIEETDVDLTAYPEALVTGWTIDDDLFAVPSYLQNSAMAYNTDELAAAGITELPSTIEEYGATAEAYTAATGKPGVVLLDNLFHLTQYMLAFGGGYDYGRTINSAENVEALEFLLDLFESGAAATAQQVGATWDGEALANGSAAMSDAGPWYVGFMGTTAPDVGYELVPMPGADGEPVVATYGGGFSVTSSAESPEVAAQVLALLTDTEAQDAILTTGLGFVPAMTAQADTYRAETPEYAAFTSEVLAAGRTLDYPLQTTEFGNELVTGFQQLIAAPGASSAQELLDSLQEKYGQ